LRQAKLLVQLGLLCSLLAFSLPASASANFQSDTGPVFAQTLVFSNWDEVTQSGDSQSFEWASASINGTNRADSYLNHNNGSTLTVQSVLSGTIPIGLVDGMPYYLVGDGAGLSPTESSGNSEDGAGGASWWNLSTAVDLASATYTTTYSFTASNADMSSTAENYVYTFPVGMITHTTSTSGPFQPTETVTFLGGSYQFQSGSITTSHDLVLNSSSSSISAYFSSLEDGALSLSEANVNGSATASVSLFHPTGHISATAEGSISWWALDSMPWQVAPRTGPSFLPATVWVNEIPFLWSQGQMGLNGQITDVYQGEGTTGFQLQFSGGASQDQHAVLSGLPNQTGSVTVAPDGSTSSASVLISVTPPSTNPGPDPDLPPAPLVLPDHPFLWINGHEYAFTENEITSDGYLVDKYVSSAMGCIHITLNGGITTFVGNCGLISLSGDLPSPPAPVSGDDFVLAFVAPPDIRDVDRLWIRGTLFMRMGFGSSQFTRVTIAEQPHNISPAPSFTLTLAPDGQTWLIDGQDGLGHFSGEFQSSVAFLIQNHLGQLKVPVLRVSSTGFTHLDAGTTLPNGLPAAVLVPSEPEVVEAGAVGETEGTTTSANDEGFVFRFAGVADSLTGDGTHAARYVKIDENGHLRKFLEVALGESDFRAAALFRFEPNQVVQKVGGYFNTKTLLFYRANTDDNAFPLLVKPLLPESSHAFWRLVHNDGGLPPTYVIRGQGWYYAGHETDPAFPGQMIHLFHGPVRGQVMRVYPAVDQQSRLVRLVDPTSGAISQETIGSVNPVRQSVTFRDGTVAFRGDDNGIHQRVEMEEQLNVHTIHGDLDLLGNHLSFGLLSDDAGLAGGLFRFTDRTNNGILLGQAVAGLESTLGRSLAEWGWSKASAQQGQPAQRVMLLAPDHKLHLSDPVRSTPTEPRPGLTLDPKSGGTSSIPGVLRVRPGGDLSMGQFQAGGEP
jgi:hypothetical protein